MSERHEDNDGSDIFWPGYVDATTNLILNLLFLLTILIVAVFMFALELGRSSPIEQPKSPIESGEYDLKSVVSAENDFSDAIALATVDFAEAVSLSDTNPSTDVSNAATELSKAISDAATDLAEAVAMATTASDEENLALKSEINRLNTLLAQQLSEHEQAGDLAKITEASSSFPKSQSGLDKSVTTDFEVKVHFKDDAIEFTASERDRLLDSLKPFAERGEVSLYVEVPSGFSEAKRMGFYRAMAVRNVLIEMALPQEKIDVLVVEVDNDADASLVRVMSR